LWACRGQNTIAKLVVSSSEVIEKMQVHSIRGHLLAFETWSAFDIF
jgi:hypothetical protein